MKRKVEVRVTLLEGREPRRPPASPQNQEEARDSFSPSHPRGHQPCRHLNLGPRPPVAWIPGCGTWLREPQHMDPLLRSQRPRVSRRLGQLCFVVLPCLPPLTTQAFSTSHGPCRPAGAAPLPQSAINKLSAASSLLLLTKKN